MSLQSTNESLAAENAQLQLENARLKMRGDILEADLHLAKLQIERIRQETIEECARIMDARIEYYHVTALRNCLGTDSDLYHAYQLAQEDAHALRSLPQGAGQPQHLPVQAEQQEQSVHQAVNLAGIPSLPSNGDVPDERATFESFMRRQSFLEYDLKRNQYGEYKETSTQQYWEVWQARSALSTTGPMLRSTRQDAHDEGRTDKNNEVATPCPPSSAQGNVMDELISMACGMSLAIDMGDWTGAQTWSKHFKAAHDAALQSAAPIQPITTMRGFHALDVVIDSLRNTALYRDEEGDDTDALEEFRDAVAALSAPAIPTWISVNTHPQTEAQYIVAYSVYGEPYVTAMHWEKGMWQELDSEGFYEPPHWVEITHWMPLPAGPAAQIPASPKTKNHLDDLAESKR